GGDVHNLKSWALNFASRFEIVTALMARSPGIFGSRVSGVKHHLTCPLACQHVTSPADSTGTFACNASQIGVAQLPSISGFAICCSHGGCAGSDRLDFLKALLEQGKLRWEDLTSPDFLVPVATLKSPEDISAMGDGRALPNIAPHLYADLPGVMKDFHDFIHLNAHKPQPALALGSTLALMSACLGQRVMAEHFETRPNLYIVGVGVSGSGKDKVLSAPITLLAEAGLLEKKLGAERLASDAGLNASLLEKPVQVMFIDEIGALFGAINNPRAGQHVIDIHSSLLTLYGRSSSYYQGKKYGDSKRDMFIDQPSLSLFGCTTDKGLFSSLTSDDVQNGVMSRFILMSAGEHDPLAISKLNRVPVPEKAIHWMQAWDQVDPIQNHVARRGGRPVIAPRCIPMDDDALKIFEELEAEAHKAKTAARHKGTDSLFVRVRENSIKLALIAACGAPPVRSETGQWLVDFDACRITAAHAVWAIDVVKSSIDEMERGVLGRMVDNPFQAKLAKVLDAVQRAGTRGLTESELAKLAAGRLPKRELDDVLATAMRARDVAFITVPTSRGKARNAYVHSQFINHSDSDDD
ncbi:MAG TPA: DUF3987 domain-containing protein, partial [Afipia sp.]